MKYPVSEDPEGLFERAAGRQRPRPPAEALYVNTAYRILFEDEFFLAVDKPSPLPVHPVGRFEEKNLLSLLENDGVQAPEKLKIVNRIDSETSGLVLVAKDGRTAGILGRQFERRAVEKEYLGIVFGTPDPKQGSIRVSLGSVEERGYFVCVPDPGGKPAETLYSVLEGSGTYSLVRFSPLTGRTHQIRAHAAYIGHPLAGDKVYIDLKIYDRYVHEGWKDDMLAVVGMPRLALHASRLVIRHPADSKPMEFVSPLPESFRAFLDKEKDYTATAEARTPY